MFALQAWLEFALRIIESKSIASITIRNLDDDMQRRLRVRAAENHRSMEEEARWILAEALERQAAPSKGLGTAIRELFKPIGGVELELLPRESGREPPTFD